MIAMLKEVRIKGNIPSKAFLAQNFQAFRAHKLWNHSYHLDIHIKIYLYYTMRIDIGTQTKEHDAETFNSKQKFVHALKESYITIPSQT